MQMTNIDKDNTKPVETRATLLVEIAEKIDALENYTTKFH